MSNKDVKSICEDCGTIGIPTKVLAGSFWAEMLLWIIGIVLIVPTFFISLIVSLAYSIRRHTASTRACYRCGGKMIPITTPRGKKLCEEFDEVEILEDHIAQESRILRNLSKMSENQTETEFKMPEVKPSGHHRVSDERKEALKEKYKDLI